MSQERLMKPQESGEEASRQNQRKGDVSVSDKATESLSTKRNDDVQNCDDNELTISSQKCMAELKVGRKNSQQASPVVADAIFERGNITIGEALEATALTAGSRPVDYSDAAAIQAAEVRATGRTNIVPGGVAAAAQSAATRNARVTRDDDKTKLSEILAGVIGAELRNDPNLTTRPGGVAASLAAAARINQINLNPPNKE
ncbi:Seed maturation protein [Cynara cardunculus var. scolymus]|uniref:Seed maturation protein n=1 Tax=Cynara cardunculus var. scolymus TaxID=59895 RepID=A0A118K552_CYNCS|nr:Seed maturation protein [Cynara cardunculus var. scolymus]